MFYLLNASLCINNIVFACVVDSPVLSILCGIAAGVCAVAMLCKLLVK